MSQWTGSARAALESYFTKARKTFAASGADAEEVEDDLRRHVDEEISAARLGVVTEQDIQQILTRIGPPDSTAPGSTATATQAPVPKAPVAAPPRKQPGTLVLLFGIILPFGTIAFEYFTGACAGILFDPFPTVWNVLLTLLVPGSNLWLWLALRREPPVLWRRLGLINGAAVGVAAIYTLFFLPVTPFALIGIIVYGIGLLPLAPVSGMIGAIVLRTHLQAATQDTAPMRGFWVGLALGIAGLALAVLPMIITESALGLAVSAAAKENARGLWWLRNVCNEEQLLRACYGRAGRSEQLYNWRGRVGPEDARAVYFKVYGRAFNSVPPPKLYVGRGRWSVVEEEFTWDNDQGGDAVAGRVKGLSLLGSRQDGFVDPNGALAYTEWTLEFKNDSRQQREARGQILLPPGGVVSRLTLWIDGEEREAAFGGRAQVKTAYKAVVTQRRDPVLVTTCGPDRVLMQCFPVPPGGRMKVRLGITAPLQVLEPTQTALRWPCFLERNFTLPEDIRHSLWMESPAPLSVAKTSGLTEEQPKPGTFVVRGELRDGELTRATTSLLIPRQANVSHWWARDSRAGDGSIVTQTLTQQTAPKPGRIVVVVDGTRGMEDVRRPIEESLAALPADVEFSLIVARDGVQEVTGAPQKQDATLLRKAASGLRQNTGKGGHDNVPALVRAWDLGAGVSNSVVVWIHGPQPVLLESMERLQQRFERSPNPPRLISVQTEPGPNCVLERLDGRKVESFHRLGELEQDLKRLFKTVSGGASEWKMVRSKPETTIEAQGPESSLHLVRLWAAEEVEQLRRQHKPDAAMQVAARYQLVTPVSGAVVLETQQQYTQAGLEPVPAETVPMVPEPSTGFLLLLGAGFWLMRGLFRRRSA